MLNVTVNPLVWPKFDMEQYRFDFECSKAAFLNRENMVLFEIIHDQTTHENILLTKENVYTTDSINISCNGKGEPNLYFKINKNGRIISMTVNINYYGHEKTNGEKDLPNVTANDLVLTMFEREGYWFDSDDNSTIFRNREDKPLFEIIHDQTTHENTLLTKENVYYTESIDITFNKKGEPNLHFDITENGETRMMTVNINYDGNETVY